MYVQYQLVELAELKIGNYNGTNSCKQAIIFGAFCFLSAKVLVCFFSSDLKLKMLFF